MLPQLEPHINPSDTAQRFTDSPLPSHLSCYSPRSPTISGPYGQVEKYDDDDELDEDSQNGEVWETQADDGVGMVSRKRNRKDAAERERLTATGTVGGIYANGGDKCDVESCQTTNEMEREPPRTLKQFVDGVIAKQKSEDKTHSGHSSTGMELPPHMIMIHRLPIGAEGLVLLTNNGEFAHKLQDPTSLVQSVFKIRLHGKLPSDEFYSLRKGVTVDGVDYGRIIVEVIRRTHSGCWLRVRCVESRQRDLIKLFERFKLQVRRYKRYAFGPYRTDDVPEETIVPLRVRSVIKRLLPPQNNRRMNIVPAAGTLLTPNVATGDLEHVSVFDSVARNSVILNNGGVVPETDTGNQTAELSDSRQQQRLISTGTLWQSSNRHSVLSGACASSPSTEPQTVACSQRDNRMLLPECIGGRIQGRMRGREATGTQVNDDPRT
eukprot:GHVQ01026905.1.p1 GENE.GHVQ01026905.1~~GHVQ01026905.1.p1  ORF type:complete len:436 (+),score=53.00 GHVQ01026905.1:291-1598(+)